MTKDNTQLPELIIRMTALLNSNGSNRNPYYTDWESEKRSIEIKLTELKKINAGNANYTV